MPRKRTKDRYFTKKDKEEIIRTHRLTGNFGRTMKLHDIIHKDTLYTILGIRDLSKRYKSDEWFTFDPDNPNYETRTYVDSDGNKITGILEDYFFFKKDDPRNNVKVVHGKRIR